MPKIYQNSLGHDKINLDIAFDLQLQYEESYLKLCFHLVVILDGFIYGGNMQIYHLGTKYLRLQFPEMITLTNRGIENEKYPTIQFCGLKRLYKNALFKGHTASKRSLNFVPIASFTF